MTTIGTDKSFPSPGYGMYSFNCSEHAITRDIRPLLTGYEFKQAGAQYFWDNTKREPACIFQYTVKGRGLFIDPDGIEHVLDSGKGFLVSIPSATCYRTDPRSEWEFFFVKFSGTTANRYVNELISTYGNIYEFTTTSQAFKHLFRLCEEGASRNSLSPFKPAVDCFAFLMELFRLHEPPSETLSPAVGKSLKRISQNYADSTLGIEQLASANGLSRAHFSRLFKKQMGCSPYRYLLNFRMNNAAELLTSTKITIKTISGMSGFSHYPHFCSKFKEYFGCTPGDFRKGKL